MLELRLQFPKKVRLVNQTEYDAVFKKAKKVSQKHVLSLYRPNQLDISRLGIIVSKRVARSAVSRNLIKRIIRESFRVSQNRLQGLDIILLMRQGCSLLDKTELRKTIDQLWEKIITCQQGS